MTKQSIFGRVSQLVKANINALIDSAEDPQKMIDQLIRDYTNNIAEAEQAIAQTIGNLRMMEDDHKEDRNAAAEWGQKALAASRKADEFRANSQSAEADRFDNLAKLALEKQISFEKQAKDAELTIGSQQKMVTQLKDGLKQMRAKFSELDSKRNQLVARHKTAQAQNQVHDAMRSVNVLDPTSELGRFEEKVRREEALARGAQELASSSFEDQFAALEDLGQKSEVEARLHTLKAGKTPAALDPGTTPDATEARQQ